MSDRGTEHIPPPANPGVEPGPEGLGDLSRFLNRDLQWLEFNRRVMAQAKDPRNPLLERVRFLSIFSSNLDEFFMKRVGGLRRQVDAGVGSPPWEPLTPAQQLQAIRAKVLALSAEVAQCFRADIQPRLKEIGVHFLSWEELEPQERSEAETWYRRNVFPILTPLAVDPGHRFPFISNMSVSLGVMLRRPGESEQLFARVKVPELGNRLYRFANTSRFVPLQEIIEHNLDDLFPGMEIVKVLPFRVTRNADVERDNEDAEDLLEQIQQQLRERRFARVVRLEIGVGANARILRFLEDELDIDQEDLYETDGLIDYSIVNEIADLDLPEHRFSKWTPLPPPRIESEESDFFSALRQGDLLVHHPYESFDATVCRFIDQAANDPRVLAIKQALYRTSGDSPFIPSLIRAAESGKQVAVLVELRARFDEARNIFWARKLEDAGVHVAYGVVGLKTHSKVALVVRQEGAGIRCYAHIGTGNYNPKTARLYEDVGLFTCDAAITDDVVNLFNYMTGRSRQKDYQRLLVAPVTMKKRFIELVDREIAVQQSGKQGRIIAKMNQLEDRSVSDALYKASQAGVKIDLIVRGFCCVRPGVPSLSDNIRICSIIGRFLEHSRIFWFGAGKDDPIEGEFFIGSADWMYRNLNVRVEAATPIQGRRERERLWDILNICLNDRRQGWDMTPDGRYVQRTTDGMTADHPDAMGTHARLMAMTLEVQIHAERHRRDEF